MRLRLMMLRKGSVNVPVVVYLVVTSIEFECLVFRVFEKEKTLFVMRNDTWVLYKCRSQQCTWKGKLRACSSWMYLVSTLDIAGDEV